MTKNRGGDRSHYQRPILLMVRSGAAPGGYLVEVTASSKSCSRSIDAYFESFKNLGTESYERHQSANEISYITLAEKGTLDSRWP